MHSVHTMSEDHLVMGVLESLLYMPESGFVL